MRAKHAVYHPTGNKRCGKQLLLEVQAIALYLFACHSQRGGKLSLQGVNTSGRSSPNAEEAQHVVNAISIKIFRHILETAQPPLAAIFKHTCPVVGRKSPVLSIYREAIGRSTSLQVKVKVMRFMPYVAAFTVYANGYITLQYHASCHSILVCGAHLHMQHILHIIVESHLFIFFRASVKQRFAVFLMPYLMAFPCIKVYIAISIS